MSATDADWQLTQLVKIVNDLDGMIAFDLTLFVGGLIVSGRLTAGREYHEQAAARMRGFGDGNDEGVATVMSALAQLFDHAAKIYAKDLVDVATTDSEQEQQAESSDDDPAYIHLTRTTAWAPSANAGLELGLWRGRLDSVSGWTMGRLAVKP